MLYSRNGPSILFGQQSSYSPFFECLPVEVIINLCKLSALLDRHPTTTANTKPPSATPARKMFDVANRPSSCLWCNLVGSNT